RAVAALDDVIDAVAADGLVDLDVVVIQAQTQARHEGRLPDGADGPGVGFFRTQVRVAAGEHVDLARVRRRDEADGCGRDARQTAQIAERAGRGGLARVDAGALAGVDGQVAQAGDLRVEQLADVRGAGGALEHGADADVLDRRPVAADLVAAVVGLGARGFELGVAVARFQVQALDEGQVLDQRDRQFGECFAHFELAFTIRNRRPGAQDFAVDLGRSIGARGGAGTTPFQAEGRRDRAGGPRAAQLLRQDARDRARDHILVDRGLIDRGQVDVVDHRLGDRAFGAEDVDRHAAGHRGGGAWSDTLGGRGRVQRIAQLGERAPVTTRHQLLGLAVRGVDVVVPAGADVAADAGQQLNRLVLIVHRAAAHLGEATVDGQRNDGGTGGAGDAAGGRDAARRAELLAHRFRDERVADRHAVGVAERPGRSVVERDVALDVGRVAVDLGRRADRVGSQGVDLITAQRRLIQVERVVVIARRVVAGRARADQGASGRI